jgi:PAP2 superfamily C-terminal
MNFIHLWRQQVRLAWSQAWSDVGFRDWFMICFVSCCVIYLSCIHYIQVNSTRTGAFLHDPLQVMLPARDWSYLIFILTYTGAALFIGHVLLYPHLTLRTITAFTAVFVLRTICIMLFPLSPPPDIIVLWDPLLGWMIHGERILNDLFFSGHMADMMLFTIVARDRRLRWILGALGASAGLLLIWQHVHYTIDIVAAPIFAYLCYWLLIDKDFIWPVQLKPVWQRIQRYFA